MLQLENTSPFKASMALFPDEGGVDTLYVAVRATFTLRAGALAVADAQVPVKLTDEYRGDPGQSSLIHPGDLHLGKPSTDIALIGDAWAPRGRPVPQMDVTLRVGQVQKTVRVFGDRTWRGPLDLRISPPIPFERVPLVYERAYGGVVRHHAEKGALEVDWRNPVGVGFGMRKLPEDQAQRRLPNLEDPAQLISSPRDRPKPACFGFIPPSWEPRRRYAGTYDEAWQETRAPYLPKDFQATFFNAAHPDLVCPGHLRGGEPVRIEGASLDPLAFTLPACELDVAVTVDREVVRPPMKLQTVVLEPTPARLGMAWLGAVGCDKRTLRVKLVKIAVKRLQLGGGGR